MTPITRSNKWWRLPLPRDTQTSDTGQGQSVASHIIMGSQGTLSHILMTEFQQNCVFCDAVVDTGPRFSKFNERKFMFQLVETDTISKAFLETIISKKYDFRSPVF